MVIRFLSHGNAAALFTGTLLLVLPLSMAAAQVDAPLGGATFIAAGAALLIAPLVTFRRRSQADAGPTPQIGGGQDIRRGTALLFLSFGSPDSGPGSGFIPCLAVVAMTLLSRDGLQRSLPRPGHRLHGHGVYTGDRHDVRGDLSAAIPSMTESREPGSSRSRRSPVLAPGPKSRVAEQGQSASPSGGFSAGGSSAVGAKAFSSTECQIRRHAAARDAVIRKSATFGLGRIEAVQVGADHVAVASCSPLLPAPRSFTFRGFVASST